jgi:hypothetical protein
MTPPHVFSPIQPKSPRRYGAADDADDEEHEGLLSGVTESDSKTNSQDTWSTQKIACTAIFFIILLVVGSFARSLLMNPPRSRSDSYILQSNGTHDFKRTVLIVSIDGLRCSTTTLFYVI